MGLLKVEVTSLCCLCYLQAGGHELGAPVAHWELVFSPLSTSLLGLDLAIPLKTFRIVLPFLTENSPTHKITMFVKIL